MSMELPKTSLKETKTKSLLTNYLIQFFSLYVQLFPSMLAISKLHCLYLMGMGFESCLAMVGNLNWKCQVFPMEHHLKNGGV